jgi:UDP-N-acetylmuramate dehydrogenase
MAPPNDSSPFPGLRQCVPLAPLTSLGLGGPARWFIEARTDDELVAALRWARDEGVEAVLLGGGSNVVIADEGLDALVVHTAQRGIDRRSVGGGEHLWTVAAGEPWDPLVAATVEAGLAGIECLSGIPGTTGATPIQNVGAYGQEVAEVVESVRVLDRESLEIGEIAPAECGFSYRDSVFRRHPGRYAVLAVTFRFTEGGAPALRYPELERAVKEAGGPSPSLASVRETVMALRRAKSMVIEAGDENRRSAGSFFVNPVVSPEEAEAVVERALTAGVVPDASAVPRFEAPGGRVKLAAGWLVERSSFEKGTRRGPVGISSRHALALVHHGGGKTADLIALAREVRRRVLDRFGVLIHPEPVFLGFPSGRHPLDLDD